ncbi:hypothetical protein HOD29_05845 [archaeon]|jgi:hypothetical protein|nr:hypothetical protein [archaeon]
MEINNLNNLAIELYKKYHESPTFDIGIYIVNQGGFHLKEILNMEGLCELGNVGLIYFNTKGGKRFEVYSHQYLSHEIKDNKLEIKLKNKNINFDLK